MRGMNEILSVMSRHRSVRSFAAEPVPDEHIRQAVSAAQQAATSSWIQAYALIQVTDASRRARLVELTGGQPHVERAGAFFAVCADVRRPRLVAGRLGKPCVGNLETFLLSVIDASLFAQNLNLAFESLGYGTCYIGGLRNDLPAVDALLDLPDGVWPLFGLCVGMPDPATPTAVRPRLPTQAVWMKDRYLDDEAMLALIDDHDVEAAEHYAERGLPGRNWSGGLWRKFVKPLRENLRDYYLGKGARLD
jgi:FMN reductase (NADPH)